MTENYVVRNEKHGKWIARKGTADLIIFSRMQYLARTTKG